MKKVALIWSMLCAIAAYFGFQKNGLSLGEITFIVMAVTSLHIQAFFGNRFIKNNELGLVNEGERAIFRSINTAGLLTVPAISIATTWFDFANYTAPAPMTIIGVALAGLGILGLFRSHIDLKKQWSPIVELQDQHELITKGIYRFARHPMYLSIFTITVAQIFLLNNWVAGPIGIIGFTLLYFSRINKEEEMLLDHFGQAYENYSQIVGRLMPKIR